MSINEHVIDTTLNKTALVLQRQQTIYQKVYSSTSFVIKACFARTLESTYRHSEWLPSMYTFTSVFATKETYFLYDDLEHTKEHYNALKRLFFEFYLLFCFALLNVFFILFMLTIFLLEYTNTFCEVLIQKV